MKKILAAVLALLVLTGCSEKEGSSEKEPHSQTRIEVSKDKNAYEPKTEKSTETNDSAYYYSYNEKEDKKSSIDAALNVKNGYLDRKSKLSKNFILKCSACHGADGKGIIGKDLTVLSKDEAFKKLMEFKKGLIKNDVMAELLINIDEKELTELSAEIGELHKRAAE